MDEVTLLKEVKNLVKAEFDTHDKVLEKLIDAKFDTRDVRLEKLIDLKLNTQSKGLEELIEVKINNRIDRLEGKLFDWKSEIMNYIDSFAREIKESREFREIIGHQTTSNTDRIENLEKKTFGAVVGDV